MTRLELAEALASAINAQPDYSARVWAKNGRVRVYPRQDRGGRNGWRDLDHVEVTPAGELAGLEAIRFACRYDDALTAAIAAVAALRADPEVLPALAPRAMAPRFEDEDVEQFEHSAEATEAAERRREGE